MNISAMRNAGRRHKDIIFIGGSIRPARAQALQKLSINSRKEALGEPSTGIFVVTTLASGVDIGLFGINARM